MAGKKGTNKSQVYPLFKDRQTDLRVAAENQAKAARGGEQRKWVLPADFAGDLLDVPNLHSPSFDRTEINSKYQECLTDTESPGTVADVICLKIQIDRLAAEERAFRCRHATVVRCFAHATGRRYGLGAGRTFENLVTQVARTLATGGV